jgi:hypothetical protein
MHILVNGWRRFDELPLLLPLLMLCLVLVLLLPRIALLINTAYAYVAMLTPGGIARLHF